MSCGIVGRAGMYRVALCGWRVCILWHGEEDVYVSCGIVGRAGMYCVAYWGG